MKKSSDKRTCRLKTVSQALMHTVRFCYNVHHRVKTLQLLVHFWMKVGFYGTSPTINIQLANNMNYMNLLLYHPALFLVAVTLSKLSVW